jgi:LDH2 family malate/lactate/ureidoglycolate dehydrogenase
MRIKLTELKQSVATFMIEAGMVENDADTFADLIVEQQIIGNQFDPVGELRGKHERLVSEIKEAGNAEVVVDKPSAMLVKGNGRIAPLITTDYLAHIVEKTKQQGIYAFGIYDSTYNDFFDVFCRRFADQNLVSIIVENGGPQGVVPVGGRKDITGTNPIAYGIPTNKYPIIFDAATAEHAWGRIRQSKERGEQLPDNAYVDKNGDITTDPNIAHAVLPFGGYIGWAINLLIDVLSGSLVRGRSGLDQPLDSQRYIGTFIITIDPGCFGDLAEFKQSTTKLVDDILAVEPVDPTKPVRVPGIKGSKRLEEAEASGFIEIDDDEWQKFDI